MIKSKSKKSLSSGDKLIEAIQDALDIAAPSSSPLCFTGTSANGDLTEAINDALKQAVNIVGAEQTKTPWTIKQIGSNELTSQPIFVRIRIHPGEGEGGGTGPKFAAGQG